MTFEIAGRKPTEKELSFVDANLTEVKRMFANLHFLKLEQKEKQTGLTEEIKSVKDYLKEIFNFSLELKY